MLMLCLLAMSALFGQTGAWLSFPAAELLTLVLSAVIYMGLRRRLLCQRGTGV